MSGFKNHLIGAAAIAIGGWLLVLPASLRAQPVSVTVTILRTIEVNCDEGAFEKCPDDYFARVDIANQGFQCVGPVGTPEDCGSDSDAQGWPGSKAFQNQGDVSTTNWRFTRTVDSSLLSIPISVQIWDEDGASDNDILDITNQGPDRTLNLRLDLRTGVWDGEQDTIGFSQGDHAKILFDISLSSNGDIDNDGIPDGVEMYGVRDGNGNVVANMAALGADPCRPTIAVEIDFMADATHSHRPTDAAVNEVVAAFNAAPVNAIVPCPYAGFPKQNTGINFIFDRDTSPALAHQNNLDWGMGAEGLRDANFNPARRPYFHYSLWIHNLRTSDGATSGRCCPNAGTTKDFIISLGSWSGQVGTTRQQSGLLMHELGHSLGFDHGGASGDVKNCKPNYLSIMSYALTTTGIPDPTLATPAYDVNNDGAINAQDRLRLDYSRQKLPDLCESPGACQPGLVEANGIGDGTDLATWSANGGATRQTAAGNRPIDWNTNCPVVNGTCTTVSPTPAGACACDTNPVSVDVNNLGIVGCGASPGELLTGYNDWGNLKYRGAFSPNAGLSLQVSSDELDFPRAEILREQLLATLKPDPLIVKTAGAATVLTGANVTYTLAARNNRALPAETVIVTDNLPDSTRFVSCNADAGGVCGGSDNNRTVTFPELAGYFSAAVTLVANVNCAVRDGTVIRNMANINSTTPDFDSSNNSSSANITASNPPPVITNLSVSPSAILWSPQHNMVDVTVNYTVMDNCGQPGLQLSVTSNEPVNGLGDGDIAPDWEVIDAHHVRLRAERSGMGTGRIYTIRVTATDSAGGSSSREVQVTVPRDQR